MHIETYGNQLMVQMNDGRKLLAYPTSVGVWVVNTDPDDSGGGGGGDGDFSWPYSLDYVTSEFGPRGSGFHEGMDWSGGPAVSGNPIPCIGDGTVHQILTPGTSGFGNGVIIYHGVLNGYDRYSVYGHMSTAPVVALGASVTKGQTLGPIGDTGNSFGAHLHMETHRVPIGGSIVWANGNPSWNANRTAQDPRVFMNAFGDGGVLIP